MKHIDTILLTLLACVPCLAPTTLAARDVTFLATSDSHYREPDHRAGNHNDLNRASIEEMNRIMDLTWPEKLGGGKIAKPRGVVMPGDLIDDGDRAEKGRKISEEQYQLFKADLGLDGTDGLLKYPVFEGWGNHDGPPIGKEKNGFSFRAQFKKRNRDPQGEEADLQPVRPTACTTPGTGTTCISSSSTSTRPTSRTRRCATRPVWHDPQGALSLPEERTSRRRSAPAAARRADGPLRLRHRLVVPEDWKAAYDAAKPYNVILYLYGHTGTGVRDWAPAGEEQEVDAHQ